MSKESKDEERPLELPHDLHLTDRHPALVDYGHPRDVIGDVRAAIGQKVQLPQGYFMQYGGQFESQEKAWRQIMLLSLVAIGGIFLLLYIALKSAR